MNIDKKALKGVVDEIEASRARQKGETEFQREALKRAVKNHQLDAKAIRIVLQRRAMGDTKRDEQDYYVHSYELALGGKKAAMDALERGATVREAAEAGGISSGAAGNLAKVVQKSSFVDTEADSLGDDAGHRSEPSPPAEQSVNSIPSSGAVQATSINGEGEQSGTHSDAVPLGDDQASDDLPAHVGGLNEPPQPGGDGRVSSAGTDDPGPIPDFLRRQQVQA